MKIIRDSDKYNNVIIVIQLMPTINQQDFEAVITLYHIIKKLSRVIDDIENAKLRF